MKALAFVVSFLVSMALLQAQEPDKAELNAKSRELMQRVQAALVTLSKTTPILQGIESAKVEGPANPNLWVVQELGLEKNTSWYPPLPPPPPPSSISYYATITKPLNSAPTTNWKIVGPQGILFYVGISEFLGHRMITKEFQLTKDPRSLKFYYYIGTCPQDEKAPTETQKKAIESVLDAFAAKFLKEFAPPPSMNVAAPVTLGS